MALPDEPGPSDEDAAMAMGHRRDTWVRHYNTTYSSMAASRAVEQMAEFRAAARERVAERQLQQGSEDEGEGLAAILPCLDMVGEDTEDGQFFSD